MTFLDSSVIIDYLDGVREVKAYLDDAPQPWLTSTICVYEVIGDDLGAGSTDVVAERQRFGGVRSLELTEELALEAGRLQNQLYDDGEPMGARDVLIATTARSTGSELVVADRDFQTELLEDLMMVTNLAK